MPDNLSPEDRIRTMRAIKSKGTGPEKRVRAMLIRYGFRGWKVNPKNIIGNPDFTFTEAKVALFIDGCFWHGCPVCNRPFPQTNQEYWKKKIYRNIERDQENNKKLTSNEWKVFRIWEHELQKAVSLGLLAERIPSLLDLLR